MSIAAQLKHFKLKAIEGIKETKEFASEDPLDRTRREVQHSIASSEKYRASVLKNVSTFAGLSPEALISAANCMEEVWYKKGDKIIEQDDVGEAFFVLEEGQVSVTRKANFRDHHEPPKELAKLGENSHFGEISLMTAETRSATVTVISQTAKCLMMTKKKFDELLSNTNKIMAENRRLIGKDVLENVSLFKNLNANNKKKLLDAMVPITFQPNSYICRQGTIGNTFYILTEGTCKVTINNGDKENEVFRFRPGDFFGEVALIEASSRRTANVISIEAASCLSLSRADFNRLLKSLQVKLQEHNILKFSGGGTDDGHSHLNAKHFNALAKKRRISGFNTHGQRDDMRVANILKRMCRFTIESLWNSMYSRMYREMLLDPSKSIEYGKFAVAVMKHNDTRLPAIQAIGEQAARILETDPPRRAMNDQLFLLGLLRQRNDLKDKLCRTWPSHQYSLLCKKAKFMRVKAFRKIIEVDHQGTCAFLILRGSVRVFGRASGASHGAKLYFEEDLFPGEVFGETALNGMHTRQITVQAITNVELALIEDQDFVLAQDRDSMHMGTEEKSKFLAQIPAFRHWDHYKLLRLAVALVQEEVNKGVVIVHKGTVCKDFYFLVNGRVDVLDSLEKRHIVTTLLKHDYLGESGLVNKFVKAASSKVQEEHYAVAVTKVDYLVLNENFFTLFDLPSIEGIRRTFHEKMLWRRERLRTMKYERAKLRKYHRMMTKEYNQQHGDEQEAKEFHYTRQVIPPLSLTNNEYFTHTAETNTSTRVEEPPEVLASILVHPNYRHSPRLEIYSSLEGHERLTTAERKQRLMEDHAGEFHCHDFYLQQEFQSSPQYILEQKKTKRLLDECEIVMSPHHATATPWGEIIPAPRERSRSPEREGMRGTAVTLDDTSNFIEAFDSKSGTHELHHQPTNSAGRLRSTVEASKSVKEKLDDIEDIPEIFVKGNDPFMVTASIKDLKRLEIIEEAIRHGSRPKSARLLINNASRYREPGYTEELIKANKARPISADFFTSRKPKEELTAEQIKEQKIAALAASLSAKLMNKDEAAAMLAAREKKSSEFVESKSEEHPSHHDRITPIKSVASSISDRASSPKTPKSPIPTLSDEVVDEEITSAVNSIVAAMPVDLKVGVSVGAVIGGTGNKSLRLRGSYRIPATQSYAEAAVALGIIKK